MATQLDIPALTAVLKQKYEDTVPLLSYKRNPLLALVRKDTDFGGKNKVFAVRNATPQGRGPTIGVAQANKTASAYNAFVVTRVTDYSTATITGEAIMASQGDENALIEGLVKEIDGAIHTTMRNLALCMFRNGGGARGQISSAQTLASTTLTLQNPGDVTNFEYGMTICTSADDGFNNGGSLAGLDGGGFTTLTIIGVDADAGTLTLSANLSTVSGVAASHYIFQTAAGVGSDYASMPRGLSAWLPATAPSSTDNFFGVNRSQMATRLAGVRIVGNGQAIEDTLIDLAVRIDREGGQPDHVFLNPLDWAKLVKSLGPKVIYDRASSVEMPEIGFTSVRLDGPGGPIQVIADLNCPQGSSYMIQLDQVSFESAGNAPMILDLDGNAILRNPTADSYDVRIGYYGNMVVHAPGWCGNAVL